jgi:ABC-type dipeptide/oligopeptide/nickel transport system permease subunit
MAYVEAEAEAEHPAHAGGRRDARSTPVKHTTLRERALRRYLRNRLAIAGTVIILLSIGLAVAAPLIAPADPSQVNLLVINKWPSRQHPFGTDASGVDMLSEAIFALRTSFTVALIAQCITLVLGLGVGLSAGYFGGKVDLILSRIIDILFSFPGILVALLLAASFGQPMYLRFGPVGRLYVTVAALSLFYWVGMARVIRSQVLGLREAQYIEAARVNGARGWWILRRHMFPNILGTTAVLLSLGFGETIALEAVLSFIGLGVTPPTASLGRMIQGGELYVDPYWYQLVIPGIILALLVLAFAFIGDGLRDALDPRMVE